MLTQRLNRFIEIQKESTSTNTVGTPTEGYTFLKNTWADFIFRSGSTDYTSEGALPTTSVEFIVRYDDDINYKCRIKYNGQYYTINHIETVFRKGYMKIQSVVWEGETANGQ